MCHTLMQTSAQRQAYLNVLPRRSLCSTKIANFLVKSKGFYEKMSLEGRNSLLLQFFNLAFPQRLQFLLLRCQEIFGITENVIFSSFIVCIILKVTSNGNARFCKSRFIANAIPHSTFLGVQILTKLTSHVSMQVVYDNSPNKRNGKSVISKRKHLHYPSGKPRYTSPVPSSLHLLMLRPSLSSSASNLASKT